MTRYDKIEWIKDNIIKRGVNIALDSMQDEEPKILQSILKQLLMSQYIKAFDKTKDMYTDEDLDGVIAFFESDAGKKHMKVTETLTNLIGEETIKVVAATNTIANSLKEI